MTDPTGRLTCPDGGRCHHRCERSDGRCFRVQTCDPLGAAHFPDDRWPASVSALHRGPSSQPHEGFVFPPLGPTGVGEPVLPPEGSNGVYWHGSGRLASYAVVYQNDRPACAFRCLMPGGSSPCDQATADLWIRYLEARP